MESLNYCDIKQEIDSFDVFLFRGSEIVSETISKIEILENKNQDAGLFTHCGIIIKVNLFPEESKYYDTNKIYIFESVLSGHFGYDIKNVDGETFFGVQLRDLDEVVPTFLSNHKTHIG
jgi:predicted oxidoreductase